MYIIHGVRYGIDLYKAWEQHKKRIMYKVCGKRIWYGGNKVKIIVEHEVSPDKNFCTYGGDFWGKDVCQYYTCRDRTHGRKAPKETRVPKCILFDTWLKKSYQKCEECLKACERAESWII